jgi:uncharacterized phiE125 gp8 family phage protein
MAVPLSTIKNALKIDYSDDDADLLRYRLAAIEVVERRTGQSLTVKPNVQYLSTFTDALLPAVPFVAISSVNYTDADGNSQTLPSTEYAIDRSCGPLPIIRFSSAPVTKWGTTIDIAYTAGYDGAPEALVHCIIALVGGWYNNPEAFQPIGLNPVPMSVEFVLSMYDARQFIR